MNLKKTSGISLLELLVAIGILVILASITFAGLGNYNKNQDLKNSAKQVVADLKKVQQYAVAQQINFVLKVDLSANTYAIYKETQPRQLVESGAISEAVIFASVIDLNDNEVIFNPVGSVVKSGEIIIRHTVNGLEKKITIKPSGYVSWEEN